jgi:tetratricopeptide (TPR) repeat protein
VKHHEAALSHNPKLEGVLSDLGDALSALGRDEEAVGKYREALRWAGKTSPKADAFASRGEYAEAVKEYCNALKREPSPYVIGNIAYGVEWEGEADRRRSPRILLGMPVDLREAPGLYSVARIINASREGLLIEQHQELALGSEVELITSLYHGGRKVIPTGKVVRIEKGRDKGRVRMGLKLVRENEAWQKYLAA